MHANHDHMIHAWTAKADNYLAELLELSLPVRFCATMEISAQSDVNKLCEAGPRDCKFAFKQSDRRAQFWLVGVIPHGMNTIEACELFASVTAAACM